MRKYILLLPLLALLGFGVFKQVTVISDSAVTSSNDSLESAWIQIGESEQVSFFITVDDTAHIKYYIDYRYGNQKEITLAVDSIKTVGTASTELSKGILLRGYGASAITNLIPGANEVRFRGYRQSDAEATTAFTASLIAF